MKKAAAHPTTSDHVPSSRGDDNSFALSIVVIDLLDTTWRIAVPVVLFAGLGIFADRKLGTKPWLTLVLTVVGFLCAAALVKRQLDAVAQRDEQ